MTDKQPTALRLADFLEEGIGVDTPRHAAAELRRLVAENEALTRDYNAARDAHDKRQAENAELLEALRGYVNDYSSEDGMYAEKYYVKVFSEAIARAEGKQ